MSHPGAGKFMRSTAAFEPGDVPTGHDATEQMRLEAFEVIHVNVGGARSPDGMVRASRLTDESVQGYVPFLLLEDLDEADTKAARHSFRSSRGLSIFDDADVDDARVRAGPSLAMAKHSYPRGQSSALSTAHRITQVHGQRASVNPPE